MKLPQQEINRKLLHLLALVLPAGIYYLPKLTGVSPWMPCIAMGILLLVSGLIEKSRHTYPSAHRLFLRLFSLLLRKNEEKQITGATYIIGGAFICSVLFLRYPHISFVVLSLFIIGDGAASLVGIRMGRIPILNKTLEGSLACLGVCLTLSCLLFPHLPLLSQDYTTDLTLFRMIITSLAITLLELIPLKLTPTYALNDNLYVPPLAGTLLYALIRFF